MAEYLTDVSSGTGPTGADLAPVDPSPPAVPHTAPAEPFVDPIDDFDERAGFRRVVLLDALLAVSVVPLLGWLTTYGRPLSIPILLAVTGLFVVAEWFPIDVEIGDQSHAFSFTAVPLVVGLCTLPPELVIGSRAVASIVVLLGIHRQGAMKLLTNVVSHVLQACTAAAVIVPVVGHTPDRPIDWLVVTAAIAAAELVGTAVVTLAISLFEGAFDREMLEGALTGWAAVVPDVLLSLVAVIVLDVSPSAIWLVAGVGVLFAMVIRLYSRVTARYRVLEVLDGFTARLGRGVVDGRMREVLLEQLSDLLHAESAWIEMTDHAEPTRLVRHVDGRVEVEPMADRSALQASIGAGDGTGAIVGSIDLEGSTLLVGVDHRRGETREFDGEDVRLFNLLTGHVGIGLQNVRLVEELRDEVRANEILATRDALTGLPNRVLFHRWVQDTLDLGEGVTVMILGLDRFTDVNETLGHGAGDDLLRQVGARIADHGGMAARLGGDEFGLLWVADPEAVTDHAQRVLDAVDALYRIDGIDLDIDVSASGGLAGGRSDTGDADATTLLRQAEVAMNQAKERRSTLGIYSADLDTFTLSRLALVGALRAAIDADDFELHFQPQLHLETEQVVGAEALLRWTPEGRQPVPPPVFIEIAERTGLITPLTRLVLRRTVAQAKAWSDAGRRLRVSANLSTRNIGEPDLVDYVAGLLREFGLEPELLELEVTETSMMSDPTQATEVMARLRDLGVTISVDDFGTGHSSLAQLTRMPVDQLKIDKQFVLDMETDSSALAVVQTIVDLGHRLGMEIVAEGVETEANRHALRSMGCTTAQGYYYARPMPAPAFDAWMASRQADAAARAAGAGYLPSRLGAPVSPRA